MTKNDKNNLRNKTTIPLFLMDWSVEDILSQWPSHLDVQSQKEVLATDRILQEVTRQVDQICSQQEIETRKQIYIQERWGISGSERDQIPPQFYHQISVQIRHFLSRFKQFCYLKEILKEPYQTQLKTLVSDRRDQLGWLCEKQILNLLLQIENDVI